MLLIYCAYNQLDIRSATIIKLQFFHQTQMQNKYNFLKVISIIANNTISLLDLNTVGK